MTSQVQKRNGEHVRFQPEKIAQAIARAGTATGAFNEDIAASLAETVTHRLRKIDCPTIDVCEHNFVSSIFYVGHCMY
ncbi:hypothetical protein KSF73_17180 [Burkholderiaceae bacterium DAT-1]|nr:hypothetical protein [Burkholderiaceae bacterium DAT-1]